MNDFDELMDQIDAKAKLSKSEKFDLRLGRLSDHEFAEVSSRLCARGDMLAEKQAAMDARPPAEPTDDAAPDYSDMADADFVDELNRLGLEPREVSLSTGMKRYRRSLGNE